MRPVHLAVFALFVVALSAGVWFLFSGTAPEDVLASDAVPAAPGAGSTGVATLNAGEADRAREAAEADAATGAVLATPELEDTATAAAEEPRVTGRVVDEGGQPVAGARVLASSGHQWFSIPLDLEDTVFGRGFREPAIEAETDDEGRFALHGEMKPGELRFAVRASGFRPLYLNDKRIEPEGTQDVGDLVVREGVVLAGRVVDLAGDGVPGAAILATVERGIGGHRMTVTGRGIPVATTDADGGFVVDELAEGPWRLMIDADGFVVREESGRTNAAGERQSGLLFVLEPGEGIGGQVTGAPAELLARLRVEARAKSSDDDEPAADVVPRARIANVTEDGAFTVGGLAAGVEYVLTARELDDEGRWKRMLHVPSASAWAGSNGIELSFEPPAAIELTVRDAVTGEPVEEFTAWAGTRRLSSKRDEDGEAVRTHPGGVVRFDELGVDEENPTARVRIRAVGYETLEREDIAIARGETTALGDLLITPAPKVVVRVTDGATGEPVSGARVYLAKTDDDSIEWYLQDDSRREPWASTTIHYGRSDDAGHAVVAAILGEASRVYVRSTEHVPAEPVDVFLSGAEDYEIDVVLFAGGAVHVYVVDAEGQPQSGVKVDHRKLDGTAVERGSMLVRDDGKFRTDDDGLCRFDHLPPGDHGFRIGRDRGAPFIIMQRTEEESDEWNRVYVREGGIEEIELTASPRGGLAGVVTEAGFPLSGASVTLTKADDKSQRFPVFNTGADPFSALSEHDGGFAIKSVPCGEYEVSVTHPDRRMAFVATASVTPGVAEASFDLPLAIIEGRVTDAAGNPLRDIEVRVTSKGSSRSFSRDLGGMTMRENDEGDLRTEFGRSQRRRVRTSADGTYVLRGVTVDVPLSVSVRGPLVQGDEREDLTLDPGEVRRDVDFQLEGAGRLEVRVAGGGGEDGFVRVRASREVPGEGDEESTTTTRSTMIWGSRPGTIDGLAPGQWTVTATRQKDEETTELGERTAEVVAGKTTNVSFE